MVTKKLILKHLAILVGKFLGGLAGLATAAGVMALLIRYVHPLVFLGSIGGGALLFAWWARAYDNAARELGDLKRERKA